MRINVHIERLILDGLPVTSAQGPHVQGALEKELARLLAIGGLSDELRDGITVPRLRAGALQLARDDGPARLGQGIARAVREGIGTRPVRLSNSEGIRR
jgi:hypothetical protein